ncbi:hypothetical protein CEXT_12471 [Caerostris extrusa]|uniref:Uncharacterized protein n=1 Tax=Caerostris extrusa TaxID=172846 RepID=A0AAV4PDS7_CAEEX|nr:hypothetical protein CEXT_12471 [Caerostris extrusa]
MQTRKHPCIFALGQSNRQRTVIHSTIKSNLDQTEESCSNNISDDRKGTLCVELEKKDGMTLGLIISVLYAYSKMVLRHDSLKLTENESSVFSVAFFTWKTRHLAT